MKTCFTHFTNLKLRRLAPVSLLLAATLTPLNADAQLSSNPDKFLGNITTGYSVAYGNEKFYQLWNQITPENESKWSSIEGSRRGSFSWGGCDNAFNYAKNHHFPFKFHCLIWGAQYPNWLNNLSTEEQYKAIEEWMDAIKAHYPEIPLIDVVNEAVAGHQPAPYKAALGGDGATGYDWIIKAFEMAHERWPDAILIYNDYNTFQWQRQQFIDLVRTLRDAGAPIDAYGCQSHDLTDMSVSNFKAAMVEIQNALKMPMYSTEYDIGTSDDQLQLQRYKEQIPYMWEADYCAGITLWGYIYGHTWTTDGNSGIIRDGKDRPAMTWLREYMKSEAAQNAKSPFPGMVKEASVYVKAASLAVTKGEEVPITINARLKTKTIDHIDLYVNNQYVCTLTEAPYKASYTPENNGRYNIKAVVTATDSTKFERLSGFTAYNPRSPFKGEIEIPGTLQAEDFDMGAEGMTYHDTDTNNEGGTSYRNDGTGVDIVTGNGGYAIGYTSSGEWLEYTVNVKEAGVYAFNAYASSGVTNSSFNLALHTQDGLVPLTNNIAVPMVTSNSWSTYRALYGRLLVPLEAGKQIIRINITGSSCNIDKIVFEHIDVNPDISVNLYADPSPATINENTTIKVDASCETSPVKSVRIYQGDVLMKTLTEAPYEATYKPTAKGTYNFTAVAETEDGKESEMAKFTLTANPKRTAYKGVIALPGILQAENFDKGGEGFTYHDSDSEDEGGANYRTDNEGVDIVKFNSNYVIGYTATDEWLEYTVNVTSPGKYSYVATVSSGATGSGFAIGLSYGSTVTKLAQVNVPQTASNSWDTYKTVTGTLSQELQEGQHIIRLTITGPYCNIDKIEFINTTDIENTIVNEDDNRFGNIYNLWGVRVDSNYKGIVIKNGKKVIQR